MSARPLQTVSYVVAAADAMSADPLAMPKAPRALPPKPTVPKKTTDFEARLKDKEREELLRRFEHITDIPFDIREHHPILQQYYDLVKGFLDGKPQTIITALLPALASNIGNKAFVMAFGNPVFCNIWTIIMGPSSITRKSTSLQRPLGPLHIYDDLLMMQSQNEMALADAHPDAYPQKPRERIHIFPSATTERFIELLSQNPNGLIVYSEIASWLQKMNKSYNGDFKADFTDWYDSPPAGKFATMTRKGVVRRPCVSVSVATTKEWFLQLFDPKDYHSGFMQRFLLCDSHKVELKDINCRIISGRVDAQKCDAWLDKLYEGLRSIGSEDIPKELTFTDAALDLHEKINFQVLEQIFRDYDTALFSYWSRIMTGYFIRFCILFTLAEHVDMCIKFQDNPASSLRPENLIITEKTAAYALKLCQFYFQNICAFLKHEVSESMSPHERKIVDVYQQFAEEAGETKTLTRSFLKTYSYIKKKQDFDLAITNLVELGVLQAQTIRNNNNQRVQVYSLIMGLNAAKPIETEK